MNVSVESEPFYNQVPNAAILSISILLYTLLIVIGLGIRRCLLQKGLCVGSCCPEPICCSCSELGLRIAEICSCCPAQPSVQLILDSLCPDKESCAGMCPLLLSRVESCRPSERCCQWLSFQRFFSPLSSCLAPVFTCCGNSCQTLMMICNSVHCSDCCKCSTLDCFCCEISIKGRPR